MPQRITKAVILAAGFGSRLKPITQLTAKSLVPFFSVPVLHLTLLKLKEASIESAMINLHHNWKQIMGSFQEFDPGIPINFSLEQPQILGTKEAYRPMSKWRNNDPVLAINSDAVLSYSFDELLDKHIQTNAYATMLLVRQRVSGKTPIYCNDSSVVQIGGTQPKATSIHSFAVAQVLSNQFIEDMLASSTDGIIAFYQESLKRKRNIQAAFADRFWWDIGTPSDYWQAHSAYLQDPNSYPELPDELERYYQGKSDRPQFYWEPTTYQQTQITPPVFMNQKALTSSQLTQIGPNVTIQGNCIVNTPCISNGIVLNNSFVGSVIENNKPSIAFGNRLIPC